METNEEYDIDNAWSSYMGGDLESTFDNMDINNNININISSNNVPKGTDIYISTKTKIGYLSESIDLLSVFWCIDITPYHLHKDGVIKKQMKFNFTDQNSVDEIQEKIIGIKNVDQYIIQQIINPSGRIKFKDIRKISIGLSNKDITSYRTKKKSAFYNCFVIIMRVKMENDYKEVHVKVFNTGKLEIPGIRCDKLLEKVMVLLVNILKPLINSDTLYYDSSKCETVLINSNFNCGFYINRNKLLDILKFKYNIDCIFDACQYPGIQCKYEYNLVNKEKYKVSFMIFRTGSVLIVGKCDEEALNYIYQYIKQILIDEYHEINVKNLEVNKIVSKKKIKKKTIFI